MIEAGRRARSRHFELRETGAIKNADALADRLRLGGHGSVPAALAPKGQALLVGRRLPVEIGGSLPAAARAEPRALSLQALIERRSPTRPTGRALVVGKCRRIFILV